MRIEECAYNSGFRVTDDGNVYNSNGPVNTSRKSSHKYNSYLIFYVKNNDGVLKRCKVHRLQAYQKYGDAIYKEGILVRHIDGNRYNNASANIEIGTSSDNQLDLPKEMRELRAINAAKYNPKRFDRYKILGIKEDRKCGMTYNELMKKYNISSKGTISYICNHNYVF